MSRDSAQLRTLYCRFMEEIKARVDIIQTILVGKFNLPERAAYELCYLQLRMICELIALAALAAHGDISATHSPNVAKRHEADWILNKLERLHPNFYPAPAEIFRPTNEAGAIATPVTSRYLKKNDLLKLYHHCGDILHRGTMRTAYAQRTVDFHAVTKAIAMILRLLNFHIIQLADGDHELWVAMKSELDGKVRATLMKIKITDYSATHR
jgi:hypothetical protein